jgi:hypothetical protein
MSHRDNENPFATEPENTSQYGRQFQDYENPFAFQTEAETPTTAKKNPDTTYVTYSSGSTQLKRWHVLLKIVASVLCLASVLLVLFSKQNADSGGGIKATMEYQASGALV